MYDDVAKKAMAILSSAELRVWLAIVLQSPPWRNGTAMLVESVRREYKLGSTRTVTAAKNRMLEAGLIVQTRAGVQHRAAMFGVTHLPLNADAMEKAGCSSPTTSVAQKINPAVPTVVALEPDHVGRANPTTSVALDRKNQSSPTTSVAYGAKSGDPARPHGSQSKNLPSAMADSGGTLPADAGTDIAPGNGSLNGQEIVREPHQMPPASAALPGSPDRPSESSINRRSPSESVRKALKHLHADPDADVVRLYGLSAAEFQSLKEFA
jgi:hypothetical protein